MSKDYEKKYNEALKRAETAINIAADKDLVKGVATTIFPELRESEDERIRKWLFNLFDSRHSNFVEELDNYNGNVTRKEILAYLEKQKEPHYTKRNALFDKCVAECDPAVMKEVSDEIDEMLEKEQKPVDDSDFKYKLAEYMTKNCTKKEGPDGYTYHISAETILEMAKEELIKRGVVQKPAVRSEEDQSIIDCAIEVIEKAGYPSLAESIKHLIPKQEWSEEDGHMRNRCIADLGYLTEYEPQYKERYDAQISWLKSLRPQSKQEWDDDDYICFSEIVSLIRQHYRGENIERGNELINWLKGYEPQPSWKPSEEQMEALAMAVTFFKTKWTGAKVKEQLALESLYEDLKKRM